MCKLLELIAVTGILAEREGPSNVLRGGKELGNHLVVIAFYKAFHTWIMLQLSNSGLVRGGAATCITNILLANSI